MILYVDAKEDKREIIPFSANWVPSSPDQKAYIRLSIGDVILDNIRVYGTSLTEAQIKKLYVEGAGKRGLLVKE